MRFVGIALFMLALAAADNWAVLVAGSDGYWNYRHQSDVAHAYQILRRGGIPEDHIITMMVNDIAYNPENVFPGEIYNQPGENPPNVYEGVKIDYEGDDNNPENFLKVLLGDESTGKKVLKSTENDNVFLFFSDHGGPDVLCWPREDLAKDDFQNALKQMHEKRMYKRFVLYIEACYSGSMGHGFPEDLGITIVTAANEEESSWATYCEEDAVVRGKRLATCLGDEFSVFWMEDTDKGEQKTETLEEQFNRLVDGVKESHVMRYGDKSFSSDLIGEYVGYPTESAKTTEVTKKPIKVDSRDAKMYFFRHKYLTSTGEEKKKFEKLYYEELNVRQQYEMYFHSIAPSDRYYEAVKEVKNVQCYQKGIAQMKAILGHNDYQYKFYHVIANMCNENPLAFSGY